MCMAKIWESKSCKEFQRVSKKSWKSYIDYKSVNIKVFRKKNLARDPLKWKLAMKEKRATHFK